MSSSPNIIFGVANFGTYFGVGKVISDPAILQQFLDFLKQNGIHQLDTARIYGNGTSEELLGSVHAAEQGFDLDTKISAAKGSHFPEKLRESALKSLDALQVKKVHTLYLHVPDRSVPIEDVLQTLNELYKEDIFERWGLSNYSVEEVTQIIKICKEKGYILPAVYQGLYNIFSRIPEENLFPLLKQEKISFYVYSPLASGLFNYTTQQEATSFSSRYMPGSSIAKLYGNQYFKESFLQALIKLNELAQKHELTKNEIALRWLCYHSHLKHQNGDGILLGASELPQLKSNIFYIKKGPLSDEVIKYLDDIWQEVKTDAPKVDFAVT